MMRSTLPPTPASSTDIAPNAPPNLSHLELAFKLPPPAIASPPPSAASSTTPFPPSGTIHAKPSPTSSTSSSLRRRTSRPLSYSPLSPQENASSPSSYPPIAPMPPQLNSARSQPSSDNLSPGEISAPPVATPTPAASTPMQRKSFSAAATISQQKRKEREEDVAEEQRHQNVKQQRTSKGKSNNGESAASGTGITLPPPPGRSRKIIQMKPKETSTLVGDALEGSSDGSVYAPVKARSSGAGRKKAAQAAQSSPVGSATAGQQMSIATPSATTSTATAKPSAATRKTARKTAHSLIERRRRFKMNEEFGVLKSMIPACRGVEMHKLAILQASIEYLKYLEDCIEKLKETGGNGDDVTVVTGKGRLGIPPSLRSQQRRRYSGNDEENEDGDDEEMADEEEGEEEEGAEGEDVEQGEYATEQDARTPEATRGGSGVRREEDNVGRGSIEWSCEGETSTSPHLRPPLPPQPFTFIHHQESPIHHHQLHHNRHYPHHSDDAIRHPSPLIHRQNHNHHHQTNHQTEHQNSPSSFVTTHNIPSQPLPPPVVSAFVPRPAPPPQNIYVPHSYPQPQTPSSSSSSSSSSSTTHLPHNHNHNHEDIDREATHALLLLASDRDRDRDSEDRERERERERMRRGSYVADGSYTYFRPRNPDVAGRAGAVGFGKPGEGTGAGKPRFMSVMDLLSS